MTSYLTLSLLPVELLVINLCGLCFHCLVNVPQIGAMWRVPKVGESMGMVVPPIWLGVLGSPSRQHFSVFWRPQNAPSCTLPKLRVCQTVSHLGGKAEVWGNCHHYPNTQPCLVVVPLWNIGSLNAVSKLTSFHIPVSHFPHLAIHQRLWRELAWICALYKYCNNNNNNNHHKSCMLWNVCRCIYIDSVCGMKFFMKC